ncbi:hypothetical protein M2164_008132 [Streptomyces sp. SAI-208]|nr:hypothetical protein [Streptomyces sp. SAI-208]
MSGAQDSGEADRRLDADRVAAALVAAVQGGVTILMSTGRITHLEAALDTTLTLLRDASPGARRRERDLRGLVEEFLRQGPQASGVVRVDGVAGDAVQGAGAAVDDPGLVAVDEVAAADAFEQRRCGQES